MTEFQASLRNFEQTELTTAEREVYAAVEQGEYGMREYARETGRSPGTVGNLLDRARRKKNEQ